MAAILNFWSKFATKNLFFEDDDMTRRIKIGVWNRKIIFKIIPGFSGISVDFMIMIVGMWWSDDLYYALTSLDFCIPWFLDFLSQGGSTPSSRGSSARTKMRIWGLQRYFNQIVLLVKRSYGCVLTCEPYGDAEVNVDKKGSCARMWSFLLHVWFCAHKDMRTWHISYHVKNVQGHSNPK